MRRLWLIFAQTCTVCLGLLFVVSTLKPDWLSRVGRATSVVLVQEQTPPSGTNAQGGSAPHQNSYAQAVKKAIPSVVNLYSSKEMRPRHPMFADPLLRRFFGLQDPGPQKTFSLGSGVIVSEQGYVLTNNHVVEGGDLIELVTQDGRKFSAKIVGTDPDTDIAVLKVDGDKLPAITLGNDEKLEVGDAVLAIGNPFGVTNTVTSGIVSALGRNQLGINQFENFIQTDAAINPGNSGGALIDTAGRLVGINSAILSRGGGSEGIGFAIPVDLAIRVAASLEKQGRVARGYLGVSTEPPPRGQAGVLIAAVQRGGPADRGGLKPGDHVLRVGQRPIEQPGDLASVTMDLEPGTRVPVEVERDNRRLTLAVELGRRPPLRRSPQPGE